MRAIAIGFVALLTPWPAASAPERGWRERAHLTGDWGGWRDRLALLGLSPGARYTTGFWANLGGGFETGTRYEGFAQWWLDTDLEALVGWKGGRFDMNWYAYHGGQPSLDLVGPFPTQTVSGWETAVSVRFYELFFQQAWGDGRFAVKVGQLAADTDFFVSENAGELLNGAFGFLGLGRAEQLSPFYPIAAPGVWFRARTADARWEVHFGVYTADPGNDESANIGFDWSFEEGAFFLGEISARRRPFGRAGRYAIGASGTTADVENFERGGTSGGAFGLYALVDQDLVEETRHHPGLAVFLRGFGHPQSARNLISWSVSAGVRVTRPLPGRGSDVLALGFAYLRFSDAYVDAVRADGLDVSRQETVLEITYRLQPMGWLRLQPNLQIFFDPHFSRRDATVLGLRAVVDL